MPLPIEDYGLIGNAHTAALVGRDGSIDWLCVPRFDSAACFAALLGKPEHGRWLLAPAADVRRVERRYRPETLILETDFETAGGSARVTDFMPAGDPSCNVVRIVEGLAGRMAMRMQLILRFGYGADVPWVRRIDDRMGGTAGPDTVELTTQVEVRGEGLTSVAEFDLAQGERAVFVLSHRASHEPGCAALDADAALAATEQWWREWCGRCAHQGRWREPVMRSLITLKALTYLPTGGIVAAPT